MGTPALADRDDSIRPGDGEKRNQVRHILNVANAHFGDLIELWRGGSCLIRPGW